jgi:hypothetical protein
MTGELGYRSRTYSFTSNIMSICKFPYLQSLLDNLYWQLNKRRCCTFNNTRNEVVANVCEEALSSQNMNDWVTPLDPSLHGLAFRRSKIRRLYKNPKGSLLNRMVMKTCDSNSSTSTK